MSVCSSRRTARVSENASHAVRETKRGQRHLSKAVGERGWMDGIHVFHSLNFAADKNTHTHTSTTPLSLNAMFEHQARGIWCHDIFFCISGNTISEDIVANQQRATAHMDTFKRCVGPRNGVVDSLSCWSHVNDAKQENCSNQGETRRAKKPSEEQHKERSM